MATHDLQARRIDVATEYFRLVDKADPAVLDLFVDDAQMFFPKFGLAKGKAQVGSFAQGFAAGIASIEHDIPAFNIMSSGDFVIIEGQVKGVTASGAAFPDGIYSQGRFCNVFEFEGEQIKRVHIYEDPDFGSADTDRVNWAKSVHETL
jgi:ketosteroid isomerase-like protein